MAKLRFNIFNIKKGEPTTVSLPELKKQAKQSLKDNKRLGLDKGVNQKDLNEDINAVVYMSNIGLLKNAKVGQKDIPIDRLSFTKEGVVYKDNRRMKLTNPKTRKKDKKDYRELDYAYQVAKGAYR